ncbi:hypothetical protein ILYODFUR_026736 [Ilyodon furcidens]|uniref:Uncharacterized protein n=1 Tax=Ilyodon furcidens TaxID=33524 RepID=A0ABV0TNV1_9TELE
MYTQLQRKDSDHHINMPKVQIFHHRLMQTQTVMDILKPRMDWARKTKFRLIFSKHHLPLLCVDSISVHRSEDPVGHVFIFGISYTSITEKCPVTGCESGLCCQT